MRKIVLVFLSVMVIFCASIVSAYAGGTNNGYNWAGQMTTTLSGGYYEGWRGVDGYIYFPHAPVLRGDSNAHSCSWMAAYQNNGFNASHWTQVGFTRDSRFNSPGQISSYLELNIPTWQNADGSRGYHNIWYKETVIPPKSNVFYVTVNDAKFVANGGTTWYGWEAYYGGFDEAHRWVTSFGLNAGGSSGASTYLPHASSGIQACGEVLNTASTWSDMDGYFGSNQAGYNGASYALHLKPAGAWEVWDTTLTAGTTTKVDWYYPPYYYSPGYYWYYFGTWNL